MSKIASHDNLFSERGGSTEGTQGRMPLGRERKNGEEKKGGKEEEDREKQERKEGQKWRKEGHQRSTLALVRSLVKIAAD